MLESSQDRQAKHRELVWHANLDNIITSITTNAERIREVIDKESPRPVLSSYLRQLSDILAERAECLRGVAAEIEGGESAKHRQEEPARSLWQLAGLLPE